MPCIAAAVSAEGSGAAQGTIFVGLPDSVAAAPILRRVLLAESVDPRIQRGSKVSIDQ
jgi:hypothetical protein